MSTYLDAVLDNDLQPIFNGITIDTVEWLKENPSAHGYRVCIGRTLEMVEISEYLNRFDTVWRNEHQP